MYDIVGDIHGHAGALKRLLQQMGYRERSGVWRHDERKIIFLGDFIDRGPQQLETVQLARAMVDAGQALAVMGNHEFNAVAWATEDPDAPGQYLRRHTDKNLNQHEAFLREANEGRSRYEESIEWFRSLPLFLDLEGIRVIHACWHKESIDTLRDLMDEESRLLPHAWPLVSRYGTPPFEAAEILLKGFEVPLPDGGFFLDGDKHPRNQIRTKWWHEGPATYRDLALMSPKQIATVPHTPAPTHILPGYENDKPVFVGHYWLDGEPEPLAPQIACLDYSVAAGAGSGTVAPGKLCAYRWDGEHVLEKARFVYVDA
jgi:hypothetical protein